MKRIFEDILDDIDLGDSEQNNIVTDLANSSNDAVDVSQYDYVLYLCFNVHSELLDKINVLKIEKVKESAYDNIIVPLKKKFDVYLNSYWTDGNIYVDDLDLNSWDESDLRNKKNAEVYYKVYLKLDGNLNHLISFIYSVMNPNPKMLYIFNNMYYCKLFKNDNIEGTDILQHIEAYNLSIENVNKHSAFYRFHMMANMICEFFYDQDRVLKFPGNLKWEDYVYIVENKLITFAKRKKNYLNSLNNILK